MNTGLRYFVSIVAASVAASALFAIYIYVSAHSAQLNGLWFVLAVAWLVCLAHIVLLGLPIFSLLRRRDKLKWSTISSAGFLAGAIPLALLMYPSQHEGYSSSANWHGNYVSLYENGEPTRYAWLSHAEQCMLFGILGTLTAVVLWRVWAMLGSRPVTHATDA